MQSGRTMPVTNRRLGFSLPELLVVMTIIAFASTVSLLAYSNYRKGSNVRGAASEVSRAFVTAQTRAIAQNLPSAVVLDLENQIFWIDDLESSFAVRAPKVVPPKYLSEDVVIDSLTVGATEFTDGQHRVVFMPDGTNPFVTVNLRGTYADTSVDANFYSVQMYPTSPTPKIWPNARK